MSDPRQRVLRAVRLLPTAVRIGRGGLEDAETEARKAESSASREPESEEHAALVAAEAEVRKLKAELRDNEAAVNEARETAKKAKAEMDILRAELEREKAELQASIEIEITERREAASKEGYDEGIARGYDEGLKKASEEKQAEYEQRFSDALRTLDGMCSSLKDAREKLALMHAPQMIRLWESMLARLLEANVAMDASVVSRVIDSILKRVSDRERIILYLNPADISMIENSKEDLMETVRGVQTFELLSDDHVDRGSCLVETNLGIYDARWRTQLEQIAQEVQSLVMECMITDESGSSH